MHDWSAEGDRLVYHRGSIVWAELKSDPTAPFQHVLDVPNGLSCGCACHECGEDLVACANLEGKTYQKVPYFAHTSNSACSATGERGLIEAFRNELTAARSINLPSLSISDPSGIPHIILPSGSPEVGNVSPATKQPGQPGSILISTGVGSIRLYIAVRKSVPDSLQSAAQEEKVPALIVLMEPDAEGMIFQSDVVRALSTNSILHWLYHPNLAEEEGRLAKEARNREQEEARRLEELKQSQRQRLQELRRSRAPNDAIELLCSGCKTETILGPADGIGHLCPTCRRFTFHWPIA